MALDQQISHTRRLHYAGEHDGARQLHAEEPRTPFSKRIARRSGTPRELHARTLPLLGRSAYITGDIIKIDGGLILPGMPEH